MLLRTGGRLFKFPVQGRLRFVEALAVAPAQEASSCGGANQEALLFVPRGFRCTGFCLEVPVAASGEKASVGGTVPEAKMS